MRSAIAIEKAANKYSAYLPELPGCVSNGAQANRSRKQAIELHLQGMREDGLPEPKPTAVSDYVEAKVA